jgi:hypothetical protein
VPGHDDDLVLQAGRVWQALDAGEVRARHRAGDRERDAGGSRRRDVAGLRSGRARDHRRGLALEIVDLDELRQDLRNRLDHLRRGDRGAERRHGAGHVDDGAKPSRGADRGGSNALVSLSRRFGRARAVEGDEARQKGREPLVARLIENLDRRPVDLDLPAVDEHDPARHFARERHFVGDQDHGAAFFGQFQHDVQDLADELGIERRGDLVE